MTEKSAYNDSYCKKLKKTKKYKRLLMSDFDQTFYINDEDIEKNKIYVNNFRKKGNIFGFATGRSYMDFMKKAKQYDLKWDYLIINHGATIIDSNNRVISNYPIDNKIILDLKKDLELNASKMFFCCNLSKSRANFEDKDLTKINAKYDVIKAKEINSLINSKYSKYVNCYLISKNSIEIISNKTSKAKAIGEVAKIVNIIDNNDIFTVGDGYSDVEMIKNYNGYCMKNSVEELLKICENKKVARVSDLIKKIEETE